MNSSESTPQFVALWTASSRQVYSFIYSLLPHWADADEAYQETSRVLWEKFAEYEPGSDFTAWACRIAYFKVLDVRSRRKRGPLAFSDAFLGTVEQELAEQSDAASPRYVAVLDCLQKLKTRDRELIGHRYREGATTATAAAELGRSVDSVYKALNRIHQALFDCVQRTLRQEDSS